MISFKWVPLFNRSNWSLDTQRNVFEYLTSRDMLTLRLTSKRARDSVYAYALYLCKRMNNPMVLSCISINEIDICEQKQTTFHFVSGHNHALYCKEYGNVYGQGNNYFGQIGTGERTIARLSHSWTIANIPRYCHTIRKLCAGDRSSYLLTTTGK